MWLTLVPFCLCLRCIKPVLIEFIEPPLLANELLETIIKTETLIVHYNSVYHLMDGIQVLLKMMTVSVIFYHGLENQFEQNQFQLKTQIHVHVHIIVRRYLCVILQFLIEWMPLEFGVD